MHRLWSDNRAVAFVEFALIAPILCLILLAVVDAGNAEAIYTKLRADTSALATAFSESATLAQSDVANILGAAGLIVAPYSSAPLSETVSQIAIDNSGNATVQWSDGTAPLAAGSGVSIPPALDTPSTYLLLIQTSYLFTPTFSLFAPNGILLTDQIFALPLENICVRGVTGCVAGN